MTDILRAATPFIGGASKVLSVVNPSMGLGLRAGAALARDERIQGGVAGAAVSAMLGHPQSGRGSVAGQALTGIFGGGKGLSESLGKNLSHSQQIHAVNQPHVANRPLLDIGKAVLSSVGGNPRLVHQAIPKGRITMPVSHFDRRAIARAGIEGQLKHSVSVVSKKS